MIGKNKWLELNEYMRRLIMNGIVDEEKLRRVASRYAKVYLFQDELTRELDYEINAFINSFIFEIKEEVRKGGEPYWNIDMNIVRERLIENRRRV